MKKALIIGINYKNDPSVALNGCINDLENISYILKNIYGYSSILQLRDDSNDETKVPTRKNILNELYNLISNSTPEDEIWFHYSGHGSQIRCVHGDKIDHLDEIIVPVDFKTKGYIYDDEIFNIIKTTKCKTFLMFDCCHSGSICELHWMFDCEDGESIIKSVNIEKQIENPNIFSICGCKNEQTSADAFSSETNEFIGAFTDSFIHVLKTHNFKIHLLELYVEACNYIKSKGFKQIPILCSSSMNPEYSFSYENS